MSIRIKNGIARALLAVTLAALWLVPRAIAQSIEVEGLIKARNGELIHLVLKDATEMTVLLNDSTNVGQVQGVFKARHKEMSMAALIPGLNIKVKGPKNAGDQLVAETIRFTGDSLKQAKAIQAGMHETKALTAQNKEELEKQNAELAKQKAELETQNAELAKQKADILAAVARFGQLDDYYILDEVTIHFGNGKTDVEDQYLPKLQALAEKAKTINGYMIEVKGFASASGSAKLNQALSEDRANNVTNLLIQQCKLPMTRMLAPGAMGESEQIEAAGEKDSEAENRRVVVRVLQNKAIAGV